MKRKYFLTLGIVLGGASACLSADPTPTALKTSLERDVVGRGRIQDDVRAFVGARIPAPPSAETAVSAERWSEVAEALRGQILERAFLRGEAARWRDAPTRVERRDAIETGRGYTIRKLRFEAVPGLWIPALLYEPETLTGRVPAVLDVCGHEALGKATEHKQIRCINLARRGIVALDVDWFNTGQLRGPGFHHGLINAVDLCGTSGVSLHYFGLKRGLEVLLAHPGVDPARVGVTGLSGGGWQTIVFSALEPRVTLAAPVAGYSSFTTRIDHASDLGDSEQTPVDLATVADYTHLTALLAPRPALLTYNAADDCCFASAHALPPLVDVAGPIYARLGVPDRLRTHVNHVPGTHNYERENREAFYKLIADHWSTPDRRYPTDEIPCPDEQETPDRLAVSLPDDNLDLNKIGLALSQSLPRDLGPMSAADRVERLRSIVRPIEGAVRVEVVREETVDGVKVVARSFRIGDSWSVPVVELTPANAEPAGTVLLLADEGRAGASATIADLVASGRRVVAVDPFGLGESNIPGNGYLWSLLVGTVGERPLGVQVGETTAVARWTAESFGGQPSLVAVGPRTSVVALTTVALQPDLGAEVQLHAPLGSLKELIERKTLFQESPELFCFGLLESFDLRQIAALAAPRPVRLVDPSDRARAELQRPGRGPFEAAD